MHKTKGKPSGTLKIKSTVSNINLLIELAEQSGKEPEIIKAEVRMAVRIAKMLEAGGVIYTTQFGPNELDVPETVKPPKAASKPKASDVPADKQLPPKP